MRPLSESGASAFYGLIAEDKTCTKGEIVPDYKYTPASGKLGLLLQKIRTTGIPAKANTEWLKSLGFTSSNDKSIPPILKMLGFIDGSNVPTKMWRDFRGPDHRLVLAAAVKDAYSELFSLYPDAFSRSDAELESYFRTQTEAGSQVVQRMVGTFKALCANAEFNAPDMLGAQPSVNRSTVSVPQAGAPAGNGAAGSSPSLHIDVQIHISPESTGQQIEQIFASMAKHLYRFED